MAIKILRGPTYFVMKVPAYGDYSSYIWSFVSRNVTDYEFDPKIKRYKFARNYIRYDKASQYMYLPIEMLPLMQTYLEYGHLESEIGVLPASPTRDIELEIKPQFKDRTEKQTNAISYLINDPSPRRGLQLQTGVGKTYCSIRAIVGLHKAALIITSGLTEQWISEVQNFTNIGENEDDIYTLKEYTSLMRLFRSGRKPKVFVASLETLRAYMHGEGKYANLPCNFQEFFPHFGIGTKVMDEVHMNFHTTTQIDLRTRIPNNIYLTATFTKSDAGTKKIFDIIYPEKMRFGANDYKKYVIAYFIGYNLLISEKKCITPRGYSHARYEAQVMKTDRNFNFFYDQLILVMEMYFLPERKPGQKLLIFFHTIQMITLIVKRLKKQFPHLKVTEYIAETDEEVLNRYDIIVSTHKSCGTGKDIKKLKCVINTCSMKAEGLTIQVLGRLRELPGETPIYIDMYNAQMQSHIRHKDERFMIVAGKTLKINDFQLR